MLAIVVHGPIEAGACSHLMTFPVLVPNVNVPPLLPGQTVTPPPEIVPAVEAGLTVIVVMVEESVQVPFVITARYELVVLRLLQLNVAVLPVTVDQLPPVERNHFMLAPTCPLRVIVPLFVPEHTVVLPVVVPPTTDVTVTLVEVAIAQAPSCTRALYNVFCVIPEYDWDVVVFIIGVQVVPPFID